MSILTEEQEETSEVLNVIQGVSKIKELERRLRVLTKVFTDSTVPTIIENLDGIVTDANDEAVAAYGWNLNELLGNSIKQIIPVDWHKKADKLQKRCLAGQNVRNVEAVRLRKDGTRIPILLSLSLISDEIEEPYGIVTIAQDMTEIKKLKIQLVQSHKLEAIGMLAGGIAHDFNNILSSIIGFTELALKEIKPNTELNDNLEEVLKAGKRASDLVTQILSFARETEKDDNPIQPGPTIKEALKLVRATTPTSIKINDRIISDSFIIGNPIKVHQIIMNLCINAVHAMESSTGVLDVSLHDITIDINSEFNEQNLKPGDYTKIAVSDTGVGINKQKIPFIFDSFYTTKQTGMGTGMGLATVKNIVEEYAGKIIVKSHEGQGTTFILFLPITHKPRLQYQNETKNVSVGNERILIIDDEAPIAKVESRILEGLGYSVSTFTNSIEALEQFKREPNKFDLVITDMTMPNMTGEVLSLEIAAIRNDIPVIICTGHSEVLSKDLSNNIGISAFLQKPFEADELACTVRKVLDDTIAQEQG